MDYGNLMKSNIHSKAYWVTTTEAAIKVRNRTQFKYRQQKSTRERLKIIDAEKEVKSDRRACTAIRGGVSRGSSHGNIVINTPFNRKSLCRTSGVMTRTRKRYKPND